MAAIKIANIAIEYGLIPVAHRLIRLYLLFIKLHVENEDMIIHHLNKGGKAIVALWHQRFFMVIRYAKKFGIYEPSAIISRSRDGELIARLAQSLGFRPIRGSSSQGGKEAMEAIVEDLSSHACAVHAVDGPRGPKGLIKPGLIRIAQLSGVPVIPVYISCSRAWKLRSWDQFLIPKPFSRILVHWGDPIYLSEKTDPDAFENHRIQIEKIMQEKQREDDLRWGWKDLL
jgi:lysophospholipid acyltransferase (LPLAT)-like uncharacterized protein